jgi:hypothetical protein
MNVYGWSPYSATANILAATVPSVPVSLASSIGIMNNFVSLSWSSPVNSGGIGVLVDQYDIHILTSDDLTFTEAPLSCLGSSSTIV